jgi:hypothetical protein
LVYVLLLAGLEESLQTTIPWVNLVTHYVMPAAMLLDWLAAPAALERSSPAVLGRWIVYPALYAAYSLARGAVTGWYPYPFLDPATGGYAAVFLILGTLVAAVLMLGSLLFWFSRARSKALALHKGVC